MKQTIGSTQTTGVFFLRLFLQVDNLALVKGKAIWYLGQKCDKQWNCQLGCDKFKRPFGVHQDDHGLKHMRQASGQDVLQTKLLLDNNTRDAVSCKV